MRRSIFTIIAAGAAALGIAAAPAFAGGMSYDVEVDGNTSGSHAFETSDTDGINFDTPTANMTCDEVYIPHRSPGSVNDINAGTQTDIAEFDSSEWVDCEVSGTPLAVDHVGTWVIHGDSAATTGSSDVIDGHVDDVEAQVTDKATGGAICSFTVTGQADGSYDEDTSTLSVDESGFTGNLTLSNVSGCLGLVSNGQAADFTNGDFQILDPATGNPRSINLS